MHPLISLFPKAAMDKWRADGGEEPSKADFDTKYVDTELTDDGDVIVHVAVEQDDGPDVDIERVEIFFSPKSWVAFKAYVDATFAKVGGAR